MTPKLVLNSAAMLMCLLASTPATVNAEPITIENVRVSSALTDEVPLSDTGTTAYTMRTGFLGVVYDIWGGIEVCAACPPELQGPVVISFVGLFEGVPFFDQAHAFYDGMAMPVKPRPTSEESTS